jgi:hypothetical protein
VAKARAGTWNSAKLPDCNNPIIPLYINLLGICMHIISISKPKKEKGTKKEEDLYHFVL